MRQIALNKIMKSKAIVFAAVTLLCVVFAGVLFAKLDYTAQAEFLVNWNRMSGGDQDYNPKDARLKFSDMLAKFKVSDQFISILCEDCNIPSTQSASIAKSLRRNMSVIRVGKTKDGDLYRVQFADNNQDVALKAVNLLCNRFVTKLNLNAKYRSAKNGLSSFRDNADSRENDQQLRDKLADLKQQQNQEYSQERAAQIQEIQGQLNGNDLGTMLSGFKTLAGIVGIFSNPAKIQEEGVVGLGLVII